MARAIITGDDIGTKICEALGIDPRNVKGFDLHIAVGDAVMITVELYPEYKDLDSIKEAVGKIATFTITEAK